MDYRIVRSVSGPARIRTCRSIASGRSACRRPTGATARVGRRPIPRRRRPRRRDYITFGCLNNFAKASWTALDLWGRFCQAVPNSRMIIHSYQGSHLDEVRERFAGHGVAGDRLEFIAKQPWSQYVATYGRIDIALDPLPWGGGITTCDTLWMGVPVVSLAGETAVGRGGKSILSNLGLGELAVRRPRQYVQAACGTGRIAARLAELRVTLRQRMLTSPRRTRGDPRETSKPHIAKCGGNRASRRNDVLLAIGLLMPKINRTQTTGENQ